MYMCHCGVNREIINNLHSCENENKFFAKLNEIQCPVLDMRPHKKQIQGLDGCHYTLEAQRLIT